MKQWIKSGQNKNTESIGEEPMAIAPPPNLFEPIEEVSMGMPSLENTEGEVTSVINNENQTELQSAMLETVNIESGSITTPGLEAPSCSTHTKR